MMQPVTMNHDPARKPLLIIQVLLVVALFVVLTFAAIRERGSDSPAPADTLTPTSTQVPATAVVTVTPTETALPPTETAPPTPTPTLVPTDTPAPTPTPEREPITLTGRGDSVVYPQKWVGPALVRINYSGGGPFFVWTQDQNGERVDQLAQSVGKYRGDSIIDFSGNERTLRFEVRAVRDWQIDVLPLSSARHETLPAKFTGTGDTAIVLLGAHPDLITVDTSGATGTFIIYAYGLGRDLVLSTTAPYAGTVAIKGDTTAIAVKATGPWTIEITTR
ncbi:MAG TPA: hypothetical protein VIU38_14515 [Anaerolineales bacterium]